MLRNVLILLLAASPALAEDGLPVFELNSVHARDLLDHTYNKEIAEGVSDYDMTPGIPQPVCATLDGEQLPEQPAEAQDDFYPLYDVPFGALPAPMSSEGYVRMISSTKVRGNKERGEVTVAFPDVEFGGGAFYDRSDLFVRMTGTPAAPALSWATVLCSGGIYLGYKGSTITLPKRTADYTINETLALGSPKALIMSTHRWLTSGMVATEDLCSDDFRTKMKDTRAATLPPRLGPYRFSFDPKTNTLKIKWENK